MPVTGVGSVVAMKNVKNVTQYVNIPSDGLTFGDFSISSSSGFLHFQGGPVRFEKTSGAASFSFGTSQRVYFHQAITAPGDFSVTTVNRGFFYGTVTVDGIFTATGGSPEFCPNKALATNAFPRGVWQMNGGNIMLHGKEGGCSVRVKQEIGELRMTKAGTLSLACKDADSSEKGTGSSAVWLHAQKLTGSGALTLADDTGGNNWVGTLAVADWSGFTGEISGAVARLWFMPGVGDSRTPYLKKFSLLRGTFDGIRARIGVPDADVNAVLGTLSLTDIMNTATKGAEFYKTGAGRLTVSNYVQSSNPQYGIINVQQGTLWLRSSSGAITQPNLTVDSDAVLEVAPDTTLTVNNATLPDPFTLGGGGKLVVLAGTRPANIVLKDGATISFPNKTDVLPSGQGVVPAVAGTPAFWVDASEKSSIVFKTGSTLRFHRWNDCRKTSDGDGYMYAAVAGDLYDVPAASKTNFPAWRKDESPNAMGFVHIQRRKAVWHKWESLYWNRKLANIRCVFMVCGLSGSTSGSDDLDSGGGGGRFLGNGPNLETESFYRGAWDNWYEKITNNGNLGGTWYRDGATISPTTNYQGYRPGFQLVEAINIAAASAESFGASVAFSGGVPSTAEVNTCGRTRICECLIYTNTLTAAERKATAEYLYRKWFKRAYPGNLAGSPASAITTLTAPAGGTVEATQDTAVTTLTADGDFTKTGAGELYVTVADTSAGMTVAEGRLTVKSAASRGNELPRAWFHADATRSDTFVTATTLNGTNFIKRWRDCNGGKVSLFTTSNRTRQPFVHTNALNGLSVVDLRELYTADEYRANHCVLFFQDAAIRSESYDNYSWTTNCNLRDVFVVWGSKGGGSEFMTADGDSGWHPFYRNNCGASASATIINDEQYVGSRFGNWRKNGGAIIPTSTALSGDYDLVSFHGYDVSDAITTCSFGYGNHKGTGGVQLGEVLVYTNALTQDQVLDVEAYLRRKWFGVETPGRVPSTVARVTALADASFAVEGSLDVGAIGGAGSVVKGNVSLPDGGMIELQVNADGSVSPLTVAAPATFTALGGGTIRLTGEVARLGALTAQAVLGNATFAPGSIWTVKNAPTRRVCVAKIVDGKLVFLSRSAGLLMFVR